MTISQQLPFPLAQQVGMAEAGGQALQDGFDVVQAAQCHQPVRCKHTRQAFLQTPRKQFSMGLQKVVYGCCEIFKRLVVVGIPLCGEKMIVNDIDQDALAVPQSGREPFFAAAEGRSGFGETVEPSVVGDAVPHSNRKLPVERPLDIIAEKGPQACLGKRVYQIEVHQVVQKN